MSTLRASHATPGTTYDDLAGHSAALVITSYSTSFGLASRLLTEPVRTHVRNVYALVRIADEIVDDPQPAWGVAARDELLTDLQEDTHRALRNGRSNNLVVHAFAGTARAVGIGPELVDPFFASMRTDLHVTEHDTASLDRYIYGSAEVVGLMCLRAFVGGSVSDYDRLSEGARRLGAAFQKVNFLRDLAEDQTVLGRAYLPGIRVETLDEHGKNLVLDDIDADLAAAAAVIPELPRSSRRAVLAAHALFAALAARLRAAPAADIARERVRVPGPLKAQVVLRAMVRGAG